MSFSVPRCSRPICGSTRSTISPSSSSTKRSTPCAAGCCGPKLIVKLRRFVSDMSAHRLRGQLHGSFGLLGHLGIEAIPRHHHALVTALADQVDAVMRLYLEHHLAAADLDAFGLDGDFESGRRRRQMADVDMGAETA